MKKVQKFPKLHLVIKFLLVNIFAATIAESAIANTLVFGRGGDSVNLDPAGVTDGESLNVTDNIFDNLLTYKLGTTEIIPSLAKSWTVSKDGKTYTFELVKNVKFHDGTPVNADAVVYSLKRQFDKTHEAYKWGGPYVYFTSLGLHKLIKDITAVNNHTVKFSLTKNDATFLSLLTMQSLAIISPSAMKKAKKDFGSKPVGSGPFVFKKWERNQKIILRANKNYWGKKPKLKTLIFRSIPDNNTRMIEMMAGNIHVMDNPNPDDISQLKKRLGKKLVLAKKPGFNVGYLALNNSKKPFNNLKVRKAIAHAINKKGIVDAIYAGYAEVAKHPMPPTLWGYDKSTKDHGYNPKLAKKLLADAGYKNGFETTIWAMPVPRPYMPDGRKVAEAIQGDLAKVGIKAKIVSYEWGTYLDKTQNGEHDMALLGWTGDIGDPDNFLYVLLDKTNAEKPAQNISFYKSNKLHEILVKAKTTSNVSERTKLYKRAQAIIHADVPMVPLAHSITVVPHSKRVKGFVVDPTGRRRFADVMIERK
jgi:ABC-type transport system substrate-binding protein